MSIGCNCKGSLSKSHRECLVEWANTQQSSICEICHTTYAHIVRRSQPSPSDPVPEVSFEEDSGQYMILDCCKIFKFVDILCMSL